MTANSVQHPIGPGGNVGWVKVFDEETGGVVRISAGARLLRSLIVAACMVSLAAGGHVTGGGSLPALGIIVALAAVALMPVAFLAGRRLPLPSLSVLLIGGQVLLHGAFEMFSTGTSCSPSTGHSTGASGAVHHEAVSAACAQSGVDAVGGMVPHVVDSGSSPVMLIVHGAAAAVVVWMLHRGESAFWKLLAWLRPLARIPALAPVVSWPQVAPHREDVSVPRARRNIRFDVRRGPPAQLVLSTALG